MFHVWADRASEPHVHKQSCARPSRFKAKQCLRRLLIFVTMAQMEVAPECVGFNSIWGGSTDVLEDCNTLNEPDKSGVIYWEPFSQSLCCITGMCCNSADITALDNKDLELIERNTLKTANCMLVVRFREATCWCKVGLHSSQLVADISCHALACCACCQVDWALGCCCDCRCLGFV